MSNVNMDVFCIKLEREGESFAKLKSCLDFARKIYNHMVVDKLNASFAALSDPTRRMILDRLTRGPATVNELAEPFRMSQQAISKHLAYLERAALIEKHREGRQHYCQLKVDPIRQVADWALNFRKYWEESHERLDLLLEKLKTEERNRNADKKTKNKRRKKNGK